MRYSARVLAGCFGLALGCALEADPNQQNNNGTPIVVGTAGVNEDGEPQPLDVDRLQLLVIGEFGILSAFGDPLSGVITLDVPPGPGRVFQLIGERDLGAGVLAPVLFGATIADITPGVVNEITIPAQDAGALSLGLIDTLGSLLGDPLHLLALDAPLQMPSDYFVDFSGGAVALPLPLGRYQIDPAFLAPASFLPPGEDIVLLPDLGGQIARVLPLLAPGEPASISLTVEGLSLRVRVLDAQGQPTNFVGSLRLEDVSGLLGLIPGKINITANGEALLSNVLGALPGLFGTAVIHAELGDGRVKGSVGLSLLDLLPPGPPSRLSLQAADTAVAGGLRPEPGDLVLSITDNLGRVSDAFVGTVSLSIEGPGFLRTTEVDVNGEGILTLPRAFLPVGDSGVLVITASAPPLTPSSTSLPIF